MRTIDWPLLNGPVAHFLVHQLLAPGVSDPRRATAAQVLADLNVDDDLDAAILAYLLARGLWVADTGQNHQMLSDDVTNGVKFRADLIPGVDGSGPISRQVWTPRSASVPAIDITPNGATPVPVGKRLGWHEFCSSDFLGAASGDPFHSMRLAVLDDGGLIGTFNFNGQTAARPLSLVVGGVTVGTLSDPEGTLYTKGGTRSGTFVIADDAAQAFPVPVSGDPKWAILGLMRNSASDPSPFGFYRVKAGTSPIAPTEIAILHGSPDQAASMDYRTGAMSGTTGGAGTDGKLSLSTHTDGNLWIQNRLGAGVSLGLVWMPQAG